MSGHNPSHPRPARRLALAVAVFISLALLGGLVLHGRAAPPAAPVQQQQPAKADPKLDEITAEQQALQQLQQLYGFNFANMQQQFDLVRQILAQHRLRFMQINQGLRQQRLGGAVRPGRVVTLGPQQIGGARNIERRLGVRVAKPTVALAEQMDLPKGQGVVVEEVIPNGAADKAGLKTNDVLLELAGKSVPAEVDEMVNVVAIIKPNTPVEAVVLRKGQRETIKGLSLPEASALDADAAQAGPEVVPGLRRGLQPGNVIDLNGRQARVVGPRFPNHGAVMEVPNQAAPANRAPNLNPEPGSNGVVTTTYRSGDRFTTRHQEGSLIITLTGTVTGGKATLSQVVVREGGESNTYTSTAKVPEQYLDKVKGLLEMTEKGNSRLDVKSH